MNECSALHPSKRLYGMYFQVWERVGIHWVFGRERVSMRVSCLAGGRAALRLGESWVLEVNLLFLGFLDFRFSG